MEKKKHEIELKDLISWQQEEKVLFASSTRGNKKLFATLRGSYEVWVGIERVLETTQPFNAVEKYNSI